MSNLKLGKVCRKEAAHRIGVSYDTIMTWDKQGKGLPHTKIGTQYWYDSEDIERFIEKRRTWYGKEGDRV